MPPLPIGGNAIYCWVEYNPSAAPVGSFTWRPSEYRFATSQVTGEDPLAYAHSGIESRLTSHWADG